MSPVLTSGDGQKTGGDPSLIRCPWQKNPGDPQFLMAEDAVARAVFLMAEDAAARDQLEVNSCFEASADQQPTSRVEFCSNLPVRATAVRNAAADLNVSQYALADLVVRPDLSLFKENLSAVFADAKPQTYEQGRRQHGQRSPGYNSRSLGGCGRLPSCWPFGR